MTHLRPATIARISRAMRTRRAQRRIFIKALGWTPAGHDPEDDAAVVNWVIREACDAAGIEPANRLDYDDDGYPPPCTHRDGHQFEFTGTAYGGDDERWHGEGRSLCVHCGADGDA